MAEVGCGTEARTGEGSGGIGAEGEDLDRDLEGGGDGGEERGGEEGGGRGAEWRGGGVVDT